MTRSHKPKAVTALPSGVPRCAVVWGPPKCGTTTTCETLAEASETPIQVLTFPCPVVDIQHALRCAEVVLVDVDSGTLSPAAVQAFVDSRVLYEGHGAVVRIYCDTETCLFRAEEGELTPEDLQAWHDGAHETEIVMRQHNLTHFGIVNADLEQTVIQLAHRLGLKK